MTPLLAPALRRPGPSPQREVVPTLLASNSRSRTATRSAASGDVRGETPEPITVRRLPASRTTSRRPCASGRAGRQQAAASRIQIFGLPGLEELLAGRPSRSAGPTPGSERRAVQRLAVPSSGIRRRSAAADVDQVPVVHPLCWPDRSGRSRRVPPDRLGRPDRLPLAHHHQASSRCSWTGLDSSGSHCSGLEAAPDVRRGERPGAHSSLSPRNTSPSPYPPGLTWKYRTRVRAVLRVGPDLLHHPDQIQYPIFPIVRQGIPFQGIYGLDFDAWPVSGQVQSLEEGSL